jgi:hypothetical protein
MKQDKLRTTLKPVAMTMQYGLCFFFLFIAIAASIEWQVKSIFIPLYTEKIQVIAIVDSQCGKRILANDEAYKIPKNCLSCKSLVDGSKITQCDFATTGDTSPAIANELIKDNGFEFVTYGYLFPDRVSLRHRPIGLIVLHLVLWTFGIFPFFLFAFKKPKYS